MWHVCCVLKHNVLGKHLCTLPVISLAVSGTGPVPPHAHTKTYFLKQMNRPRATKQIHQLHIHWEFCFMFGTYTIYSLVILCSVSRYGGHSSPCILELKYKWIKNKQAKGLQILHNLILSIFLKCQMKNHFSFEFFEKLLVNLLKCLNW